MLDLLVAPKQYVQNGDAFLETGMRVKGYGKYPMVLADERVLSIIRQPIEASLLQEQLSPRFVQFGEESSYREIDRLIRLAKQKEVDFILGAGGGKALDVSRIVAGRLGLPLVTLATSASTCSAASTVALIYENGMRRETFSGKGPELVLVDTGVISRAPFRLLAAGMADSVAKWYEGKPVYDNLVCPDAATQAAMNLSTQIKETIFAFAMEAKQDVESQRSSEALERIVEANILLTALVSSLGGQRLRAAVAHGLLYGLGLNAYGPHRLHGEIVAFGVLVQLSLENKEDEFDFLLPFFSNLGLPLSLADFGTDVEAAPVVEGVTRACEKDNFVKNMPFPVTPKELLASIRRTDAVVETYRKGKNVSIDKKKGQTP
jgi:glycerol dehydrogenase